MPSLQYGLGRRLDDDLLSEDEGRAEATAVQLCHSCVWISGPTGCGKSAAISAVASVWLFIRLEFKRRGINISCNSAFHHSMILEQNDSSAAMLPERNTIPHLDYQRWKQTSQLGGQSCFWLTSKRMSDPPCELI